MTEPIDDRRWHERLLLPEKMIGGKLHVSSVPACVCAVSCAASVVMWVVTKVLAERTLLPVKQGHNLMRWQEVWADWRIAVPHLVFFFLALCSFFLASQAFKTSNRDYGVSPGVDCSVDIWLLTWRHVRLFTWHEVAPVSRRLQPAAFDDGGPVAPGVLALGRLPLGTAIWTMAFAGIMACMLTAGHAWGEGAGAASQLLSLDLHVIGVFAVCFCLPIVSGQPDALWRGCAAYTAVCAALGLLFMGGGVKLFDYTMGPAIFATAGAAVGTIEGMFERSIATTQSGLLGGAASGALAGLIWSALITRFPPAYGGGRSLTETAVWLVSFAAAFVVTHLGIGSSLALGRYIRDWPKRSSARPDGDAAPPGA